MITYLALIAGLVILVVAGDLLVRGAVGMAERLGIPALIIGLTVVAFGTSAPELVVSMEAAASGAFGLAIGNVVGSPCSVSFSMTITAAPVVTANRPRTRWQMNSAISAPNRLPCWAHSWLLA